MPLGPMEVRRHDTRTVAGEGFVLADDRPTVMRPDPNAGAVVIAADRALLDRAVTRLTGRPTRAGRVRAALDERR